MGVERWKEFIISSESREEGGFSGLVTVKREVEHATGDRAVVAVSSSVEALLGGEGARGEGGLVWGNRDGGHVRVNTLSGTQAGKEFASAELAVDISIIVVVKQPSGVFSKFESGKGGKGGIAASSAEEEGSGTAGWIGDASDGIGGINAFAKGCFAGGELREQGCALFAVATPRFCSGVSGPCACIGKKGAHAEGGGLGRGAVEGGCDSGTQGVNSFRGFEEVKGHGPWGGGFGGIRVCKDGADCSVVAAFGGVAGGTACANEGVTGGGEVGGANEARGKPSCEGGG